MIKIVKIMLMLESIPRKEPFITHLAAGCPLALKLNLTTRGKES